MKKFLLPASAVALVLSGCTTTEKVSIKQPGDRAMSCQQLQSEFDQLDMVLQDADGDKGVNTANVAAVLFFWPAAVRNYMDADKAEELAQQRQQHLLSIYNEKDCDAAES